MKAKEGLKTLRADHTSEEARATRARAYLRDLVEVEGEDILGADFLELSKNELNLEILRGQQIRIQFLKEKNDDDALYLTEAMAVVFRQHQDSLNAVLESRYKIDAELDRLDPLLRKLNALSNMKELDEKIKKFAELEKAMSSIAHLLSDERIANILALLSKSL